MVLRHRAPIALIPVLLFSFTAPATTYYISAQADSATADGSLAKPFRTIQKAAGRMTAGDTCLIRTGIYRETVIPGASGAAGRPVVFMPYRTDTVFVSAADPVTGWTKDAGAVWKAPVGWDMGLGRNQLFVNGEAMYEARVPNIDQLKNSAADGNVYHWANTTDFPPSLMNPAVISCISGKGAGVFKIWVGAPVDGDGKLRMIPFFDSCRLANAPQDFLMGALVHKTGNYWSSEAGLAAPGWGMEPATSSTCPGWMYVMVNASNWESAGGGIAFIGKRCFLDAQKEWVIENGTIYFRPPGDRDPTTLLVELKRRGLVFDCTNRDYVEVHGLNFLGGSINMNTSNNCVFDNCHARYITHWTIPPNFTTDRNGGLSAIFIHGKNNRITNSSIEYSAASGVFVLGDGNLIDNCIIHDCDYIGTYEVGIATGDNSPGEVPGHNTVSHCTMYNFGRSALTYSSAAIGTLKTAQKWTFNNIFNSMFLADDGGSIYTAGQAGCGTEISYNWFHDMVQWWNTHHIYFDYGGDNCIIHHNVFWQYKGNAENNAITTAPMAHIVYNNTSIDSIRSDVYKGYNDDERGVNALWADGKPADWGIKDARNFDFTLLSTSKAIDKGGFRADSQYQYLKNFLQNGYSFKLDTPVVIPDSAITGKAPDLGAYEYGKPRWVPGHTWGQVVWNYPPAVSSAAGVGRAGAARAALPRCALTRSGLIVSLADGAAFSVRVLDLAGRSLAAAQSPPGRKRLAIPSKMLPPKVLLVRVTTAGVTRTFTVNPVR